MERQGLCLLILITAMVLLRMDSRAQQNLVPNPSFEDTVACPTGVGQLWRSPPWQHVGGDGGFSLYHECAPIPCGIPISRGGGGYARTGEAYVDLGLVHNNHVHNLNGESNFLGVPLASPLVSGHRYLVEMHLSLFDSARFACRNIGVHFSNGIPVNISWSHGAKIAHLLSLTPQVRYDGDFLTDKEDWMRIEGSFIAQGGESYLTIGNFDGYSNSDTLNLHEGGVIDGGGSYNIGYWEVAYYFIDDVSVVQDTSWHVSVNDELEIKNDELRGWPNPASDVVNLDFSALHAPLGMTLKVTDVLGRDCFSRSSFAMTDALDVSAWPEGIYLITITDHEGNRYTERLVVQH